MCKAAGSTDYEADLVADNLVMANLSGHDSHGVGMLPWYFECAQAGSLKVNQHAEVVRGGEVRRGAGVGGQWATELQ